MSASGPRHDGPNDQEPLEELFGAVFDLADEIASRISQDQVEARLRHTLHEAGRHQKEKGKKPTPKAARRGQAGTAPQNDPSPAASISWAAAGDLDAIAKEILDELSATPDRIRYAVLRAAFAELPVPSQQLLSMLISDPPPSYAEISAELGIPVASIGQQRKSCLAELRAIIVRHGSETGANSWTEAG